MTIKIEQGFLKINVDGFHGYLDKIGDIVDIFYKKNKTQPVNFAIQNHKLIIINPEKYINRVEIDHKSIFVNYNTKDNIADDVPIKFFVQLVNDVLKLIKYKGVELSRIGHAIHHIVTDDAQIQELQSKIFTSKNVIVITDTIFEIPFNNKIGVQKTISTPIDMLINKKVLLLNIDFFTKQNEKIENINNILKQSIEYFNNKLFDGLYA